MNYAFLAVSCYSGCICWSVWWWMEGYPWGAYWHAKVQSWMGMAPVSIQRYRWRGKRVRWERLTACYV